MKLSLSCRITEPSNRKDVAAIPIGNLVQLAAEAGFVGLSMRASAVSVDTPHSQVIKVRKLLDNHDLLTSMVTGNVPLATNSSEAPETLRNITPHLNLAELLGAKLVRVMIQRKDDIPFAKRAADEAKERSITLAQQTHWGTLAETIESAIELMRQIARKNVGITFEPANLLACGDDYTSNAIRRLAPHIVNFYFQNIRLDPNGTHVFKTLTQGHVSLSYVALDDPTGIAIMPLIDALHEIGYGGWISIHQPLRDEQTVEDAIDEAAKTFLPLVS